MPSPSLPFTSSPLHQDHTKSDAQAAASFASLSYRDRQSILTRFHRAGKTLRVGAFGRGDTPASSNPPLNTIDVAKSLANFTKTTGLDGIDINFEDTAAVDGFRAPGWLNSFHAVLIQELGFFQPTGRPTAATPSATALPSVSARIGTEGADGGAGEDEGNEGDEGGEGDEGNEGEGDEGDNEPRRRSRLGLPARRAYDEGYRGRERKPNHALGDDGRGRIGIPASPSSNPSSTPSPSLLTNATKPFNIDTVHGRRPLVPRPERRTPLLTYSPPATLFSGPGGELFGQFFTGKQSSVSRLLVQFYSQSATYDTPEGLFGNGTETAPGRARIASLTGWDAQKIVVQKPLQENQPGHVGAEQLGKLFCEAGQRVNGLSVWRIDYHNTGISNDYLAGVKGFKCGNKPSSPPPNPTPSVTPSQTPSVSASVSAAPTPSVNCPVVE